MKKLNIAAPSPGCILYRPLNSLEIQANIMSATEEKYYMQHYVVKHRCHIMNRLDFTLLQPTLSLETSQFLLKVFQLTCYQPVFDNS